MMPFKKASYFDAVDCFVAKIGKVGTSSLARAIIRAKYPEIEARLQPPNAMYANGLNSDNILLQSITPSTLTPDKPVHMFVRDPLLRFPSAMAQERRMDVDNVLDELEAGEDSERKFEVSNKIYNFHLRKQFPCAQSGQPTYLYKFPEHIAEFCTATGLENPLPQINEGNNPKPVLTAAQVQRVLDYYADDVVLFNSIITAGQLYVEG